MEFYKEISLEDFGALMADKVQDIMGKDYSVEFKEIVKNNGLVCHAVVIHRLFDFVSPAIYIDGLYEQAIERNDIRFLPEFIVGCYHKSVNHNIEVEFFTEFSKVSDHLTFKVVNAGRNEFSLRDVPCRRIEDLALVPICIISDRNIGEGNIVIRNDHIKLWEITDEELWENIYERAKEVSGVKIENLSDFSVNKFGVSYGDALCNMFVITNEKETNGASAAFFPGVLKEVAARTSSDLILIPSSIHEMISIPAKDKPVNVRALLAMIKEVNNTVVSPLDFLSDNAYYYDSKNEKISILEGDEDE